MIKLSDNFNYKKLLRFTFPSVIMMVIISIYGVVDGFFVSNYVGKETFTAVNFIMPFIMILGGFGFMFGTGGGALISKTLGEGRKARANGLFSMVVTVSAVFGVAVAVCGILFLRPVAAALGAEGELLENSVIYARIVLAALPAYFLQCGFQSLFVTAEKPNLGLYVTLAAGVVNMVLDALFIVVFKWGLVGAAAATAISQYVGGIIPIFYFLRKNSSLLKLGRHLWSGKALFKVCTNGSSELMTNISMSAVSMLYNVQLLRLAGEDGVAAYGVLMYVNMIFIAVFIGFSIGTAPIIGYNFGAQNHDELRNVLRKSLKITGVFSVCMFAAGLILSKPMSAVFVGYDKSLLSMTAHAFKLFSCSFLFAGFAIFGSSFFTSLNDGLTSALISFLRTLVFQVAAVMIFPLIWKLDGIWFSIVAAEAMAVIITVVFLFAKRKKYKY